MQNLHRFDWVIALGVVSLSVPAVPSLSAQAVDLTKPDNEFPEPFTLITSIREVGSGKIYVSDLRDKIVQFLDMDAGSAIQVGREGQGPGEYSLPAALLPQPNDGTLLQDMLARRMLRLTPAGRPGDFFELPSGGQTSGFGFSLMNIRGVDAKGRFYYEGSPISADGASPDSVPILRWDGADRVDTLFNVKNESTVQVAQSSGGRTIRMQMGGSSSAYPSRAVWGVAPDGRIAMVTPTPYQVTWIDGSGKRTGGPVVPYTPIKVTEADKKAFREARQNAGRVTMSFGGGGGGGGTSQSIQLPDPEFPDVKPPFLGNVSSLTGGSVLISPEGEVWVLRTRTAKDNTPTYDIFDRTGKLSGKATLNSRSRVVGFGAGTVYVARLDEDDLQYLQRYKR